jgi:hypothetical protein
MKISGDMCALSASRTRQPSTAPSTALFLTSLSHHSPHVAVHRYQSYGTIATTPWSCKPLIGACSDAIPIFGYNKRYYIVLPL